MGDDDVRETVLAMVRRALERTEAEVGTQARGREGMADVWHAPIDAILERIRREWLALEREPRPGEIVWLQAVKESRQSRS
jgi:hypothetical protein